MGHKSPSNWVSGFQTGFWGFPWLRNRRKLNCKITDVSSNSDRSQVHLINQLPIISWPSEDFSHDSAFTVTCLFPWHASNSRWTNWLCELTLVIDKPYSHEQGLECWDSTVWRPLYCDWRPRGPMGRIVVDGLWESEPYFRFFWDEIYR